MEAIKTVLFTPPSWNALLQVVVADMHLVWLYRPGVGQSGAALAVVVLVQQIAAVQSTLLHRTEHRAVQLLGGPYLQKGRFRIDDGVTTVP